MMSREKKARAVVVGLGSMPLLPLHSLQLVYSITHCQYCTFIAYTPRGALSRRNY